LRRFRLYAAAFAATLVLGGWWTWHRTQVRKAEAEKAVFFAYLRGPLSDYLLAANQALPILLKRRPDPAGLEAARQRYAVSAAGMDAVEQALPEDDWRTFVHKVRAVHAVASDYASAWAKAPLDLDQALSQEKTNRGFIILGLEAMRDVAKSRWRMTLEEELEVNALLTSLKEARAYAQKGLEGSGPAK
jgi:hypothetical protein